MPLSNRAVAEFIGTFWLVLGGCGARLISPGGRTEVGGVGRWSTYRDEDILLALVELENAR